MSALLMLLLTGLALYAIYATVAPRAGLIVDLLRHGPQPERLAWEQHRKARVTRPVMRSEGRGTVRFQPVAPVLRAAA